MRKRLSLQDKAFIALKKAVREVIEHHKKTGRPLAIWQNNRVAMVSPHRISRKLK